MQLSYHNTALHSSNSLEIKYDPQLYVNYISSSIQLSCYFSTMAAGDDSNYSSNEDDSHDESINTQHRLWQVRKQESGLGDFSPVVPNLDKKETR
jgi:hypothetical protein